MDCLKFEIFLMELIHYIICRSFQKIKKAKVGRKTLRNRPKSHPRHLVGKRTAQRDIKKDISSDSQVNSYFPYRSLASVMRFKIFPRESADTATFSFSFYFLFLEIVNISKGVTLHSETKISLTFLISFIV